MWQRAVFGLVVCALAGLLFWSVSSPPARVQADPEPARPEARGAAEPAAKGGAEPAARGPASAKLAASRITAVTVYTAGALVTREVDVPEGAGLVELTVSPLPPSTVSGTLYTEGTESIRVMATRYRTRPVLEDTREDVRKLQDEIGQLQQTRERVEADLKALQDNMQFLTKMENFTAATAVHAPDKPGAPSAESAIALAKHVMESRETKAKEGVALQQQLKTNQERTEFARRKLTELAWNPNRTERDAVIVVDKADAAAGKVRLSYLVEDAAWVPQYRLRAGKTAKDPVRLEYLAAVTQHTGEDWSGVNLVLSTAQSTLNAAPPDLQSLQVAVVPAGKAAQVVSAEVEEQIRALRAKALKDLNQKKLLTGASLFNTAAALDQSWEILNADAAVRRGCALAAREGPSVTYHLPSRLTLPSRAEEQSLEVTRLDLEPEYYYKAVPVLTSHVYRLADLVNKSKHVLLPGEATLYDGNDFVGQMNLPLVAIGERFTAGFGVDPQLQVERRMVGQTRSTQGGNTVVNSQFMVRLSSYRAEPVKVQVWERLPHARSDTAGVSLTRTSHELNKDDAEYVREQRPNNLLRWDVTLEPGMNGKKALELTYEFKLEHARDMVIASFQTAGIASADAAGAVEPFPLLTAEEVTKVRNNLAKLSPEDRQLAEAQVWCAIDQESALGISGPPQKLMIGNRPVFVCCKGCLAEAKAHPDQTLAALDKLMVRVKAAKK